VLRAESQYLPDSVPRLLNHDRPAAVTIGSSACGLISIANRCAHYPYKETMTKWGLDCGIVSMVRKCAVCRPRSCPRFVMVSYKESLEMVGVPLTTAARILLSLKPYQTGTSGRI